MFSRLEDARIVPFVFRNTGNYRHNIDGPNKLKPTTFGASQDAAQWGSSHLPVFKTRLVFEKKMFWLSEKYGFLKEVYYFFW